MERLEHVYFHIDDPFSGMIGSSMCIVMGGKDYKGAGRDKGNIRGRWKLVRKREEGGGY